jgi:hypothetical protein
LTLGWLLAQAHNFSAEYTRLAAENEQMRLGDERMLRGRTNFERPGVTEEEVRWIETIAADYGMPPEILYAMRRTENGGSMLFLGAQKISPEIRLRYPPLWWQFAQGAKTWNKHLSQVAMSDPYLRHRTIWSFAKQWNPDPEHWTSELLAHLDNTRGSKGLAVTEPSRTPTPSGVKAKGGGPTKPTKHTRKEKKR